MSRIRDLIEKLGDEDRRDLGREFLAPVTRSARVRLRLRGVVCDLAVTGKFEEGWSILRATSPRAAEVVRPAPLAEVKRFLDLLPRARLVAAEQAGSVWLGLPAAAPEKGIRVEGFAPISLAPRLRLFETAVVRFDGAAFLFESAERAPAAAWLREELGRETPADALRRKGLTLPERTAYEWHLAGLMARRKPADQRRLERTLEGADASLVGYTTSGDEIVVTFRVDGAEHTAVVKAGDLTVESAGICLDGEDRKFDLASLVGVMREARRNHHVR